LPVIGFPPVTDRAPSETDFTSKGSTVSVAVFGTPPVVAVMLAV
jgi:hypothetical protein